MATNPENQPENANPNPRGEASDDSTPTGENAVGETNYEEMAAAKIGPEIYNLGGRPDVSSSGLRSRPERVDEDDTEAEIRDADKNAGIDDID